MAFVIIRSNPLYCPSRDGLIGETHRRLPNTYETFGCARGFARLFNRQDEQSDDSFYVADAADSHWREVFPPAPPSQPVPAPADLGSDDEWPF